MNELYDQANADLIALAHFLAENTPPHAKGGWQGADVLITDHAIIVEPNDRFVGRYRQVVTSDYLELSWIFGELRDLFKGILDFSTKFEFYGRLVNATLRYQAQANEDANLMMMLFAVLHEAFVMLDEMRNRKFKVLNIAVGNTIADDCVERGDFNEEQIIEFFGRLGIDLPAQGEESDHFNNLLIR